MSRPWMPLYVADYLGDTQHLSTIEHGAYMLLIMHYWQQESLPADESRLARIARMTAREWSNARATLAALFDPDWKHGRIDVEIALTDEKYDARAKAGHKGGKASALARKQARLENGSKQKASNASSNATAKTNQPQPHPQPIDSEASASGADAPVDHRKRLFSEGLSKLSAMTGKGPDACRSFVGKCLKAASDDAVTVLGLIEDAERNQVINPSAWIAARLKPMEVGNGKPKNGIIQAADDLCRKLASFDGPAGEIDELRGGAGEAPPRLLSHG